MMTNYQTLYVDSDGTKWEAIPTNKLKNRKFDIFKNGIKCDLGALRPWDIEQTINFLRERDNE